VRAADRELLPALAHELGNLLAAVRLSAHLLPHEADPRERARGARQIEELAAEAGELAALLRPLAGDRRGRAVAVDAARALAAARDALGELGAARLALRPAPRTLPRARVDPDALHHVLASLARAALAASAPAGEVVLASARRGGRVALEIADATPLARGPALRGRALRARLADAVLRRNGGRVELASTRAGTRVRLSLPEATPPAGSTRPRSRRRGPTPAAPAGPRRGRPRRGPAARSR
jgi:glucose-6-phosphate-specific signal transduction histidine kinase